MEVTKNNTDSVKLVNLYEQGQYEELDLNIANITQSLYVQWHNSKDSIQKGLRQLSLNMSEVYSYIHDVSSSIKSVFNLGTLAGTLECFTQIISERNRTQIAESKMQEYLISVKYLEKIFTVLGMHGIMSHRDLSDELGLKPSTLTEAMKKVLDTDAVQAGMSGKYKYTLTDLGVQMDKLIRKKKAGRKSVDEVLNVLQEYLSYFIDEDEKDRALNHLLESLNRCLEACVHVNDKVSFYRSGDDSTLIDESNVKAIMQLPGTDRKSVILEQISDSLKDNPTEVFIPSVEYQFADNYIDVQ